MYFAPARSSGRFCWGSEINPRRRVIAGVGFAANFTVDASGLKSGRNRRTEQQMVQPKPRVPRPTVSQVTPEREHGLLGIQLTQRIGPTHIE
jgi:hypothetical protein